MILAADMLPLPGDWASFGAAGLMGALWIWERRLSRTRESQLSQTHERLMANLIRRNTAALSRLQVTQDQLVGLLSNWRSDEGEAQADKGVA